MTFLTNTVLSHSLYSSYSFPEIIAFWSYFWEFWTTRFSVTRKTFKRVVFFYFLGLVVPAIALVCLGNTGPDETNKAIVLLVVAVGINSAVFCGFNVNHMDLSPKFTGTLMGITNGTSNIFGIVAPLLVQFLVADEVSDSPYLFFNLLQAEVL